MDQFFTGDKSGIDNFVSQMKQISDSENLGWVEDLGNGKLKFNIDDEDIAKRFHISTEAVQALIRAMQEYTDVEVGSKDGTQDFNQSIEEMTKKADEAKQHLQEMQNSNLDLNFEYDEYLDWLDEQGMDLIKEFIEWFLKIMNTNNSLTEKHIDEKDIKNTNTERQKN